MISSVLEHLKMEDIQLLLENRGLPSIGDKQSLTERLQGALCEEICEFEWEQGEVPACHAGKESVRHLQFRSRYLKDVPAETAIH
jgi:hypothetical protein